MSDRSPPARRRRRWRVMLPTLVVLGLAVLWSIAWFTAAWFIERGIADARAQAAGDGVILACAEDGVRGYPFRFAYRCTNAVLTTPDVALSAPRVLVTAQAYDPRHLIAEAEGPLELAASDGRSGRADWSRLLLSARSDFGRLRTAIFDGESDPLRILTEVGVSASDLVVETEVGPGALSRLSAFARPAPETQRRDVEVAVDATALRAGALNEPVDVVLRGRLFDLPDLDGADFVARWLGQGGAIGVTQLDIAGETALVRGEGRLTAGPEGEADAEATLAFVAPTEVPALFADEGLRGIVATLSNALLFTGRPTEVDGRDALALDVVVEDGDAQVGILPLGALPPLF